MFLPRKTKNSSWEVLTKNLVTFKRWDEVKDKKFVMLCRFSKNPVYRRGGGVVQKTNMQEGIA